jgi:histone H3/H4
MSDDERIAGAAGADDELSLPKATVQKLISEMLPKDISCSKDTRDLLIECCVEFIHLLSSESNEVCEKDSKKTIAPEHVVKALQDLGFESFTGEVKSVLSEHKAAQKVCIGTIHVPPICVADEILCACRLSRLSYRLN